MSFVRISAQDCYALHIMKLSQTHALRSFFLLTLAFICGSSPATADESASLRTISVTGTATTRTTPDTVVWDITTTASHLKLVSAKEQSDKQMQAILSTARKLGVEPNDLQTGFLAVRKEYKEDQYGNWGDFKGFLVTRQITIKERDTSRFDEFLTSLIKSSDMEVHYTLESSRLQEIQADTRLKSVVLAQKKASAMAGALGAEIGEVLTVTEAPQHSYGTISANAGFLDDVGGGGTGTFAPGSIEVQVTVGVVFELK